MLLCLSIYNVAMVFHLFIDSIRLGILYWYILIFLSLYRLVEMVYHIIALRAKMSIGVAHMCHGLEWSEYLSIMKKLKWLKITIMRQR